MNLDNLRVNMNLNKLRFEAWSALRLVLNESGLPLAPSLQQQHLAHALPAATLRSLLSELRVAAMHASLLPLACLLVQVTFVHSTCVVIIRPVA